MALAYKQAITASMYEQTTGQYSGQLGLQGQESYVCVWGNTAGTLVVNPDGTTKSAYTSSAVAITGGTIAGVTTLGASAAAITGGTINGTTIGATTPAAVTATTFSSNSTLVTAAATRVVDTTAALATVTIAASKQTTYIATPAASITVTLAAPTGDGERRRITFGSATTVTWAVTAPATVATIPKTAFLAGDSVEVVYNSVAGTPANSTATTWYQF